MSGRLGRRAAGGVGWFLAGFLLGTFFGGLILSWVLAHI